MSLWLSEIDKSLGLFLESQLLVDGNVARVGTFSRHDSGPHGVESTPNEAVRLESRSREGLLLSLAGRQSSVVRIGWHIALVPFALLCLACEGEMVAVSHD